MLSILIPIYNYPISKLVTSLNNICSQLNFEYEIICYEDGSTKHIEENKTTCNRLKNTIHFTSKENKGSISSRKQLCQKSKYNWLLFLDADVELSNDYFIETYSNYFNDRYDAIYGGCSYDTIRPKTSETLRWTYGKSYEEVSAKKRNKTPYKHLVSANFLIKKNVFNSIVSHITNDAYGYDLFMAAIMKHLNTNVLHIDNPIIHRGLDSNTAYLKKVEKSIETNYKLVLESKINTSENSLLKTFKTLKKFGLTPLVYTFYKLSKTSIKKQILGSKPNIKLLQLYKLGYLCALSLKRK